jgi:hypothetical protein
MRQLILNSSQAIPDALGCPTLISKSVKMLSFLEYLSILPKNYIPCFSYFKILLAATVPLLLFSIIVNNHPKRNEM